MSSTSVTDTFIIMMEAYKLRKLINVSVTPGFRDP
jgi:hypothetical protein